MLQLGFLSLQNNFAIQATYFTVKLDVKTLHNIILSNVMYVFKYMYWKWQRGYKKVNLIGTEWSISLESKAWKHGLNGKRLIHVKTRIRCSIVLKPINRSKARAERLRANWLKHVFLSFLFVQLSPSEAYLVVLDQPSHPTLLWFKRCFSGKDRDPTRLTRLTQKTADHKKPEFTMQSDVGYTMLQREVGICTNKPKEAGKENQENLQLEDIMGYFLDHRTEQCQGINSYKIITFLVLRQYLRVER